MKLQPDRIEGVNVISGLSADAVSVNGVAHTRSIVIPWVGEVSPWGSAGFEALTADDFDRLAALEPELIIFGSGKRIRFVPPLLLRSLMARRIGIETMDTAAACRTYNVLAGESRKVVAALLLG
ncbi:Mth938-like domain-containing protein [Piscinibacter gummiphilus]|uniref:Mth938-like domain-containing protein n=1 Tax=Piscinibacter gummiphilus TaxID=946333 RepID=A0ABZ0CMV2_9BURK|nr:Mth938-like domain-containing protein [Piscinibacter gummiphilus]WOB06310.1 Mth938-like domain-containing protein [Piscinibacter gummiphilus]